MSIFEASEVMDTARLQTIAGDIAKFISRVVPWALDGNSGFINSHWRLKGAQGFYWGGRPHNTVDSFISSIHWALKRPQKITDIYFCLSLQAKVGQETRGKPGVARSASNALALKSIWLDIDVKDTPKGYASKEEALAALDEFLKAANLPFPSCIIASGGGLHVYWISNKALSVPEWQPYAEGLKASAIQHNLHCDAGLTTDCARILRVPDTFNYKTDPPRKVEILWLDQNDLDFAAALPELAKTPITVAVKKTRPTFDLSAFSKGPTATLSSLSLDDDHTGDGIKREWEDTPLDPTSILKGCPFFKDAFVTHGKDHGQPLWNLVILATTFWQKGEVLAHELGNAHPGYTAAETDKMFDRKAKERDTKGLGWPSCAAIENEGCRLCGGCPHHGKIKSPLHLALASAPTPSLIEETKKDEIIPVSMLLALLDKGADIKALLTTMNQYFAVVRYGSQVLVASILGDEINCIKDTDFHKMLANLEWYNPATATTKLRAMKERIDRIGGKIHSMTIDEYLEEFVDLIDFKQTPIKLSSRWFKWEDRRYYLGRGLVFEPGGPLEIRNDMINLWRGFGIEPKQGNWSLLHDHIFNVVCSGNPKNYDYLIRWMALAVQQPSEPMGVAVAFRGGQGAGKGVVARTFGRLFGKHFAHIANGDQLTGRFNAGLGTSCFVFLDEALWAGDKKSEGVLKALITEPRLQLEAKFKDPIMVENRLRIMVASNNDWMVPAGIGDRRWFVLDIANTYAGTKHRGYWASLYAEIEHGGAAAMFRDLLNMDLSGFDVRAVPDTAAKAQQQAHSLHGTDAWLHHILNEGAIGHQHWKNNGLDVRTHEAYCDFLDFSKQQRDYKPDRKSQWAKKIRTRLGLCVANKRETIGERARLTEFGPLADCRYQFAKSVGAPDLEWEEPDKQPNPATSAAGVDEPTELGALLGVPGVDGRPLMPEQFERTMAQAAADLTLVQKKT